MHHKIPTLFLLIFSAVLLSFGQRSTEPTVAQELKQLSDESADQIPPDVIEAGKKGLEELIARGVTKKAVNVGDKMPAFSLLDSGGKTVTSDDLLKKGPLVVTFYRGAWCPFCNLYLRSLQRNAPKFKEYGANIVAISVEPADRSLGVAQNNKLDFSVLSDPNFEVARKFGIVYEMPKVTNDVILKLGLDLAKYNGTEKAELPLSATYVTDRKGKIVYAFLDPDYQKRAEHADVIRALSKLKRLK